MMIRTYNILSISFVLCFFSNNVVHGFVAPSPAASSPPSAFTTDRTTSVKMSTFDGGDDNSIRGDDHPTANDLNLDLDTITLPFKLAGVVAIKTAKDIVNYPPMLLDRILLESQQDDSREDDNSMKKLPQTNPAVMLAKLMGILVFKTIHDVLYFPKLWTERLVECQSLEECEI